MRLYALIIAASVVGCGDNSDPGPAREKPSAPTSNDPSFQIASLKHWYLIGDGVTPGDDTVQLAITPPAEAKVVDAWIGSLEPVRMQLQDGQLVAEVSIADLGPGTYSIVFSANGSDQGFAAASFQRSSPYYVLVSTDWDFSDPGDASLTYIKDLHLGHPAIRMTDFIGPYLFTDPANTDARKQELATWIANERDTYGVEIGLHIHPYCNFVEDAGVTCITDVSTVYPAGDPSGYTIEVSAYSRTDFETLLQHASDLFFANGLGRPTSFRAGGWTADLDTLLALIDKGFHADSSAMNWARLYTAWKGYVLYDWNMAHWTPIDDTSQPYTPSMMQVLPGGPMPLMPLLEVPDNGVMIDYASLADMTTIFDENWQQHGPLARPTTLMMGFHPAVQFSYTEYRTVYDFLTYADQFLASDDNGPVVYTTLGALEPAFQ